MSSRIDTDDPTGLPLGYLLHSVAMALRTHLRVRVLDPSNLSFPEYICMRALSQSPGRSSAELAREIGVSPQAMNIVLKRLQERGLVIRPRAATAGRSLPAAVTRQGAELLEGADAGVRAAERDLLDKLGEEDRCAIRRILAVLADAKSAQTQTTRQLAGVSYE
jgi:DNA-binding MarR family transcriptional regulator